MLRESFTLKQKITCCKYDMFYMVIWY